MASKSEYIGFIRYRGKPVDKGYLDARKSAEALLGFDEALRHFVGQQDNQLAKIDYEIPVRIRKGSWEALIPHDIPSWIQTALGIATTAYVAGAATQMAKHDFKDVSITEIFKKSLQAMQWVIKIGKHLGTVSKQTYKDIKWKDGNQLIGIPNFTGDYLYIPKLFLDLFEQVPVNILRKLASIVTDEIKLDVVVWQTNKDEIETLEMSHKKIFFPDVEECLFPDLKHGMEVKLTGLVTRGNGNSNNVGFLYQDHILTCYPKEGNIVRFKPALFVESEILGIITRKDKFGEISEPRPKIIFDNLTPLEKDSSKKTQPGLYEDEV